MTPNNPSIQQKMSLMKGWTTEVVINAPRQLVWDQVTNFEAYSDWNPFMLQAHARFEVGATIRFFEDLIAVCKKIEYTFAAGDRSR